MPNDDLAYGKQEIREDECFEKEQRGEKGLRHVPGAMSYVQGQNVIYNLLDPIMGQFMGRCIGTAKKAGIKARGTGQFSISLNDGQAELLLDAFYQDFCRPGSDLAVVMQNVVAAAKAVLKNAAGAADG